MPRLVLDAKIRAPRGESGEGGAFCDPGRKEQPRRPQEKTKGIGWIFGRLCEIINLQLNKRPKPPEKSGGMVKTASSTKTPSSGSLDALYGETRI